jgi:hypothetical protein
LAKSGSKGSNLGKSSRSRQTNDKLILVNCENGLLDLKDPLGGRSHVKFDGDIDEDMDVRRSYQKNNQKMINIYLKKPYKVLTIDQIKSREKMDREQNQENVNPSPNELFIAENNLKLHTLYREKSKFATSKGKFKNKQVYDSIEEEQFRQKGRRTGYGSPDKNAMNKGEMTASQVSEDHGSTVDHDPIPVINSSPEPTQSGIMQMTSSQLKQLRD